MDVRSILFRAAALLAVLLAAFANARAQISAGTLEISLRDENGAPLAGQAIVLSNALGFNRTLRTDAKGDVALSLPYGNYRLSVTPPSGTPFAADILIPALEVTVVHLTRNPQGSFSIAMSQDNGPAAGLWSDSPRSDPYPDPLNLQGLLLNREPETSADPLNLNGLEDYRSGVLSQRGYSWTGTGYNLNGMNVTDPYQPGRAALMPDTNEIGQLDLRSGFAQTTSSAYGTAIDIFPPAAPLPPPPGAGQGWRGDVSTLGTGSPFFSSNLPPPSSRGEIQQNDKFLWLTRDHADAGGPVTARAQLFVSATGQWDAQSIPVTTAANDLHTHSLFGDARFTYALTPNDQLDFLYSGSVLDLSGWGLPAGMEDFTGRRLSPFFNQPWGFANETESDGFLSLQLGWTHLPASGSLFGTFEARYQYALAHLDTTPSPDVSGQQSTIELLRSEVTGAPPLSNLATRQLQQAKAVWQPPEQTTGFARHLLIFGANYIAATPTNRYSTPNNLNLITANGAPAFVVDFTTPGISQYAIESFSLTAGDHIELPHALTFDLGGLLDISRGGILSQANLIAWNTFSPRASFAWRLPYTKVAKAAVIRGAFFRAYVPLAGSYLDYGNPNSLGGSEYQWLGPAGETYDSSQRGTLLANFGGPYSSIAPGLRRPYANEFDIGADISLTAWFSMSFDFFRRDDKDRLAVLNTGVPDSDYSAVPYLDPGPTGTPGLTSQYITVYSQNPATLGQDRYLLTNPPDLREMNKGVAGDMRFLYHGLEAHASITAEQNYGATNPGDSYIENDPGVVGTLFLDPNTAILSAGQDFMDRAFEGKISATYTLPRKFGGIELASTTDYFDGLVFGRYLFVTGLPQGPFLVLTTYRSTQGPDLHGGRSGGSITSNLRIGRAFAIPTGTLHASLDILNLTNEGARLVENDITGTNFNLRLPLDVQSPRYLRFALRYQF